MSSITAGSEETKVQPASAAQSPTEPPTEKNPAPATGAKAADEGDGIDRRRRRRAKISAQILVAAPKADKPFHEVCTTIDVSRDGLLFTASNKGYTKGQSLNVTFPYSKEANAMNQAQPAEVVRVSEQLDGKFAVAVQFEASKYRPEVDRKRVGPMAEAFAANNSGRTAISATAPMVLAVESDEASAEMMRGLFKDDGYKVVVVATGTEALEVLRNSVPSVFIAEVEAEDISGQDLCLIIKRSERLQNVPVILLTRSSHPSVYSASHQLGAVVCMAKPFQPDRLQHVVRLVAPPPVSQNSYGSKNGGTSADRSPS
jgi:CheY-like chemotaxis protein